MAPSRPRCYYRWCCRWCWWWRSLTRRPSLTRPAVDTTVSVQTTPPLSSSTPWPRRSRRLGPCSQAALPHRASTPLERSASTHEACLVRAGTAICRCAARAVEPQVPSPLPGPCRCMPLRGSTPRGAAGGAAGSCWAGGRPGTGRARQGQRVLYAAGAGSTLVLLRAGPWTRGRAPWCLRLCRAPTAAADRPDFKRTSTSLPPSYQQCVSETALGPSRGSCDGGEQQHGRGGWEVAQGQAVGPLSSAWSGDRCKRLQRSARQGGVWRWAGGDPAPLLLL